MIVKVIYGKSLVTDEVLVKVEKIVTDSLKPFLNTPITPHTIEED